MTSGDNEWASEEEQAKVKNYIFHMFVPLLLFQESTGYAVAVEAH